MDRCINRLELVKNHLSHQPGPSQIPQSSYIPKHVPKYTWFKKNGWVSFT